MRRDLKISFVSLEYIFIGKSLTLVEFKLQTLLSAFGARNI